MINYYSIIVAGVIVLLSTRTTTVNGTNEHTPLNNNSSKKILRKLSSMKTTTDKDTSCEKLIEGHPSVCLMVCTEVTSTWGSVTSGSSKKEKLLDEYSTVYQYKCDEYEKTTDGWADDGHTSSSSSSSTTSTHYSGKSGKSTYSSHYGRGKSGKSGGYNYGSSSGGGKSGKSGGRGSGYASIGKSGKSGGGYSSSSDDKYYDDDYYKYSTSGEYSGNDNDDDDDDDKYHHERNAECNINELRSELEHLINGDETKPRKLAPKILRLGFHDCTGGCDGCVDMDNPDNKGLLEPIEALYYVYKDWKDCYSRADVWALATLVSADVCLLHDRPKGVHFPLTYIGREDCSGANDMGIGGPHVDMAGSDMTNHELITWFYDHFGFTTEETVTIMGAHTIAIAARHNQGFGNLDEYGNHKEEGWVYNAKEYILDHRYYEILVDKGWALELVHNEEYDDIPSRYQWYLEKDGKDERPIMTNSDMAMVYDMEEYMYEDEYGNDGAIDCEYGYYYDSYDEKEYDSNDKDYHTRRLADGKPTCPHASHTIEMILEYKEDNTKFLYAFEHVLTKMINNGYHVGENYLYGEGYYGQAYEGGYEQLVDNELVAREGPVQNVRVSESSEIK